MAVKSKTGSNDGMKLRFLKLPAGLKPLVEKYGRPQVQVTDSMSVFAWLDVGKGRGDAKGLVLAKAEAKQQLRIAAADVAALSAAAEADGRNVQAIVVSSGSPEPRWRFGIDVDCAYETVKAQRLSWIASSDAQTTTDPMFQCTFFDWEPDDDDRWIEPADGEILELSEDDQGQPVLKAVEETLPEVYDRIPAEEQLRRGEAGARKESS